MSLTLTPKVLDHSPETLAVRPLATQLADQLRVIFTSDLDPGDPIPSEDDIASAVGVSRPTVRVALKELLLEGLIVSRKGARTRVAIPPTTRYYDVLRYARTTEALDRGETPRTAFVDDFGARDEDYVIHQPEITKEPATAQDAEYLRVKRGTSSILRRRMVQGFNVTSDDGKTVFDPIQIHRQAMVHTRAKNTDIAKRIEPAGGILAELRAAGIRPTHYAEWWKPRNPNRTEQDLLAMGVAAPVWEGIRVYIISADPTADDLTEVDHEVVQVSKIITPWNRMTLYVSGRLPPAPSIEPG